MALIFEKVLSLFKNDLPQNAVLWMFYAITLKPVMRVLFIEKKKYCVILIMYSLYKSALNGLSADFFLHLTFLPTLNSSKNLLS